MDIWSVLFGSGYLFLVAYILEYENRIKRSALVLIVFLLIHLFLQGEFYIEVYGIYRDKEKILLNCNIKSDSHTEKLCSG